MPRRAHELTPTPEMDVSGVVSRRIRARSQPKHKTFFYKNFLKKNFLKSLTNFNLTPFGPQNRRILCLCQTEILGQLLNFTKEVLKHRTRNVKNLRLRRIWPPAAPAAGRNQRFFFACGGLCLRRRLRWAESRKRGGSRHERMDMGLMGSRCPLRILHLLFRIYCRG